METEPAVIEETANHATAEGKRVAFSISEFCFRNAFGTGTYHKLKRLGLGPDELRVGNIVRITREAELAWQRARTHPQGTELQARERAEAVAVERGKTAGRLSAQSNNHVSKTYRRSAR